MSATVVWCNKCKTAVWAYDHMSPNQDIRGFANMASLPCPKCGEVANFDGWSGDDPFDEDNRPKEVYDYWSLLQYIFNQNVKDGEWAISPDCTWFRRPDEEMESDEHPADLTHVISDLTKERYRSNILLGPIKKKEEDKQ